MGSAFRISIEEGESLAEAASVTRERGGIVTGVDIHGTGNHIEIDWAKPRMLVFGSEAHGFGDEEISLLDETIRIPMAPEVESLNLAVSAGIILFEARRQLTMGGRVGEG